MNKRIKHGTTTITLSIPKELKSFFDELAENGYNRSFLMHKMTKILVVLYRNRTTYPGGLHEALERLLQGIRNGNLPSPPEQESSRKDII